MRVLIALGGNAMTAPDGSARPDDQIAAVTGAMEHVADLVVAGHEVALTHGNGPQVGNILVKNELAADVVPPVPLDWCGAQTQGTIGFILLDALQRAFWLRGVERPVAALVTRTRVDADDPLLVRPSKPVGRYLPYAEARTLIEHGQNWEDRGERGWRRVVASPEPREVLDADPARVLLDQGYVVVVGGGGGIPVVHESGGLRGIEAVIDKDLTAALLARALGVDALVIATDVDHVQTGYGTAYARALTQVTSAQLRSYAAAGEFAAGSMGPKVEAVCRFVEHGGRRAVITSLAHIEDAVTGAAGTVVS
ncbi:MAG: carbamate kinase [Streptosporangiales bacterium]|nr:carbamate kinase [Streptosporangiales bacterium]